MTRYKLTNDPAGGVRRDDGAFVPADPANDDWRAFLAFKLGGGVPDPADVLVVTSPDPIDQLTTRQLVLALVAKRLVTLDDLKTQAGK